MPAGNAHRILSILYDAFTAGIGPGILADPGDAGTIRPTMNFQVCEMVSGASGETRTLASPNRVGIRFILRLLTDGGGNVVVTAAAGLNVADNNVVTFGDASDALSLVSVTKSAGVYRWEIVEDLNTALSS